MNSWDEDYVAMLNRAVLVRSVKEYRQVLQLLEQNGMKEKTAYHEEMHRALTAMEQELARRGIELPEPLSTTSRGGASSIDAALCNGKDTGDPLRRNRLRAWGEGCLGGGAL